MIAVNRRFHAIPVFVAAACLSGCATQLPSVQPSAGTANAAAVPVDGSATRDVVAELGVLYENYF